MVKTFLSIILGALTIAATCLAVDAVDTKGDEPEEE